MIKRFFDWLGYVSKEDYKSLEFELKWEREQAPDTIKSCLAHDNSIHEGNYSYEVHESKDNVFLLGYCKEVDTYRHIKVFPKTSEDVAQAQTICDMLNNK